MEPRADRLGPFQLERSRNGYGWRITAGKRVRWNSRRATTRMWPQMVPGADEHCNRAVTVVLWPLGSLDVWWEPRWRTGPGFCPTCTEEYHRELGYIPTCCDDHPVRRRN